MHYLKRAQHASDFCLIVNDKVYQQDSGALATQEETCSRPETPINYSQVS